MMAISRERFGFCSSTLLAVFSESTISRVLDRSSSRVLDFLEYDAWLSVSAG